MTRGNQREIDRQRAQARAEKNKPKEKTSQGDILKKKETDAEKMRLKQKAAQDKRAADAAEAAGTGKEEKKQQ